MTKYDVKKSGKLTLKWREIAPLCIADNFVPFEFESLDPSVVALEVATQSAFLSAQPACSYPHQYANRGEFSELVFDRF